MAVNRKYKYAVNKDGSVTYTAEFDGVKQTLWDKDISSKEALESQLDNYTNAYLQGKDDESPEIGDDIKVGTTVTAEATED